MRTFVLSRLLILVPTVLGVTFITFMMIRAIPGDPVLVMLGERATPEEVERLRGILRLDEPLLVQYLTYLRRFFGGDWGVSIFGQEPVLDVVSRRFVATLQLIVASTLVSSILGIGLGVVSALFRNSWFDKTVRLTTLFAFSVPTFWLALLLVLWFAVGLGWFPSLARGEGLAPLVLPVATISAWQIGLITRTARISVLETLREDFVATARAKGIGPRRIMIRHVLRNSLIPVVTIIALQFGGLIGGAVVTEVVFSYPGLGLLIVDNIFARDYPVVQGAIVVSAVAFMVINFASDLLYAYLDPRIRRQSA